MERYLFNQVRLASSGLDNAVLSEILDSDWSVCDINMTDTKLLIVSYR